MRIVCLLLCGFTVLARAESGFECRSLQGARYRIEFSKNKRLLTETINGKNRLFPLASPNHGRGVAIPGRRLVYNGWRRNSAFSLDFSTEVHVRYYSDPVSKKAQAEIGIIVDDKRVDLARCRSLGVQTAVVTYTPRDSVQSHAEFFVEASSRRGFNGDLSDVGLAAVQSALKRFLNDPAYPLPLGRKRYKELTSNALKAISPVSVERLRDRLGAPEKAFFEGMLSEERYQAFPETLRYISWVREGSQPAPDRNLSSIRAGFYAFSTSTLYGRDSVRALFSERVAPYLAELNESEIRYVSLGLDAQSAALLHQLWGRQQLKSHPEILKFVTDIETRVSDKKKFDPLEIKLRLESFMRSDAYADEHLRSCFVRVLSPSLRALLARQKEDILAWFGGKERTFIQTLFY